MRHPFWQIPSLGSFLRRGVRRRRRFAGSRQYWEQRYAGEGNSGAGSYGELAAFKASTLNAFVSRHGIRSVVELGCGDGNQLSLASYPVYVGFDVSPTAVRGCRQRFREDPSKRFELMPPPAQLSCDLALSLDVIYHLVEDDTFEDYMRTLFRLPTRFVIVYSSDSDRPVADVAPHVRHRQFTAWVDRHAPGWRLVEHVPNEVSGSDADFFVFAPAEASASNGA